MVFGDVYDNQLFHHINSILPNGNTNQHEHHKHRLSTAVSRMSPKKGPASKQRIRDFAPGPSDFECRTAPCSSDQNLRIAPSIAPDQSPTTDQYLHENIADFWEVSRKWISHLGKLFCDRFLDLKFERSSDMGLLICRFLNAINYVLIYRDVWHRSRIRQQ